VGTAFVHATGPELVHAERGQYARARGVECQAARGVVPRLGVEAVAGLYFGDLRVEVGVSGIQLQDLPPPLFIPGGVTAKEVRRGEDRERRKRHRIHLEGLVRLRIGAVEGLTFEVRHREDDSRVDVLGIEIERLPHHRERGAVAVGEAHPGPAEQGRGVARLCSDDRVVGGDRLGTVVAIEEEVTERDPRVPVARIGGNGLVVHPERVTEPGRIGRAQRFETRRHGRQLARREPP
jgi:hypothetical protein